MYDVIRLGKQSLLSGQLMCDVIWLGKHSLWLVS